MRRLAPALLLLVPVLLRANAREVFLAPLALEPVAVPAFKHRLDVRVDMGIDDFSARAGTETFRGLYTRAQPGLVYRFAPARSTELYFKGAYSAQSVSFTAADGRRVDGRSSAGAAQPVAGFKVRMGRGFAMAFETAPPTAAARDPRLGDGPHYGGRILFGGRILHFGLAHTARLSYAVRGSTWTARRRPGAVTEAGFALTRLRRRDAAKDNYVYPVLELHGVYRDRERLDGRPVRDSATLAGRTILGFVMGKVNRKVTHLTQVGVAVGFGDALHRTEDPRFGLGDVHLLAAYGMMWGKRS